MIDHICARIPFDASVVITDSEGRYGIVGIDLHDLEINLASRSVARLDDGTISAQALYHPYESVPTSFTGMALKVHLDSAHWPCVEIKASPAKILQGHNVFGSDCIESGWFEMLGYLYMAYPILIGVLYVQGAEIQHIDVTYSCRMKDQDTANKVLDYLSRVRNGQTRLSKKRFDSSIYWGGQTSRLINHKCYLKHDEYIHQFAEYKKLAAKNDKAAQRVVDVMSDERLINFTVGLMRFESRVKKRWLERNQVPTNVYELIKFQRKYPNLLQKIWLKATKSIFEALRGHTMKLTDRDSVEAKIYSVFDVVKDNGRVCHRRSKAVFYFYKDLIEYGYDGCKKRYSSSTFYDRRDDLLSCGFSLSYLQNLETEEKDNVIPFVKLIEIDFNQQLPEWFVPPVSQFNFKIA